MENNFSVSSGSHTQSSSAHQVIENESSSSKKQSRIYLYILLIVLVFVASGLFMLKQTANLRKKPTLSVSSITQTVTVTPVIETQKMEEPSHWQTFTSFDQSFSFQYPADWQQQPNSSLKSKDSSMEIWIEGNTVGLECLETEKKEVRKVGGQSLEMQFLQGIKGQFCDESGKKAAFFIFPEQEKKFSLLFIYDELRATEAETLFQEILSTFSFILKEDASAVEKAAASAYSKKNGQPPEGAKLKVSELQVKGDFAMGNIIVTATEDGGPSLSKFMAHKQDGKWQVALEYTTTYLEWFKSDGSQFFDDQDTYVFFRDEHYGIK